jgi:uncharacterized protein YmfQ (DUF2313 family)
MALTTEDYLAQMQNHLPPGPAWPRDIESLTTKLLTSFSEEYARIDARINDLLDEIDPQTTLELLPDWERILGLPDECVETAQTIQQRRAAVLAKLRNQGGQSRAYFIALAAYLGFEITITEFTPFRAGISAVGDPLCGTDWWYAWRVNAPETTSVFFRVGSSAVGEPLQSFGNELLECVFSRLKPAHTNIIFAYGS